MNGKIPLLIIIFLALISISYGTLCSGTSCSPATSIEIVGNETTPPTITIYNVTPTTIEADLETSYINVTVSDDSGIDTWNFTITQPNGSISLELGGVVDDSLAFSWGDDRIGIYNITIWAVDSLGNEIIVVTNVTIIDTTDPAIELYSPTNYYNTSDTSIRFLYNVSDNTYLQNCSLYINNLLNLTNYTNAIIENTTIKKIKGIFDLGFISSTSDGRGL